MAKQVGQTLAARMPWVLGSSLDELTAQWPWAHPACRPAWTLAVASTGVAARNANLGQGAAEEQLFKS